MFLGFMLIAGRCRKEDEALIIKDVLEKNFKKIIDLKKLFNGNSLSSQVLSEKVLDLKPFNHQRKKIFLINLLC